jgi:hypothetical protein
VERAKSESRIPHPSCETKESVSSLGCVVVCVAPPSGGGLTARTVGGKNNDTSMRRLTINAQRKDKHGFRLIELLIFMNNCYHEWPFGAI